MADVDVEIDSFVGKFRQLWRAGLDVHLDLNAHAGNAWVGIKLNLGQPKSTQQQCETLKKRYSPCRIRRRERRAASRQDHNLTDSENVHILNKDGNKSTEIGKSSSSDSNQMAVVAEEANIEPMENLVTSLLPEEMVKGPIPKSAIPSAISPIIPFQPIILLADLPPHFPSSGLTSLNLKFKELAKIRKKSPKLPPIFASE